MHPREADLALYAGGEASLWSRARVSRHVRECVRCAGLVREFQALREWARSQDELPDGVDWVRLAAEMKANIRVGLAAGECVEPAAEAAGWRLWRPALALPALLVVALGWWLQSWPPPAVTAERAVPAGLVIRAGSGSLEVQQDGRGMALLYPKTSQVTLTASGGTLRARYVDADTGYVTISHVYTQ